MSAASASRAGCRLSWFADCSHSSLDGKLFLGAFWTLAFFIVSLWLGFAFSLRSRVVFSLQTLSNLLAACAKRIFRFGRAARAATTPWAK